MDNDKQKLGLNEGESYSDFSYRVAIQQVGAKSMQQLRDHNPDFEGDWYALFLFTDIVKSKSGETNQNRKRWQALCSEVRKTNENIRLDGVSMPNAAIKDIDLGRCSFMGADFSGSTFENVECYLSFFDRAKMSLCSFKKCDFVACRFIGAALIGCRMTRCDFFLSLFNDATLTGARFAHTNLDKCNLNSADLGGAKGHVFSRNSIDRTVLSIDAPDPWSILRRKYTGPMLAIQLSLFLMYIFSYVIDAYLLSASSAIIAQGDPLRSAIEQMGAEVVPAWWVLIGGLDGAWGIFGFSMLLVYNVLRFVVTVRTSTIRDHEDRIRITPAASEYMGLPWPRPEKQSHSGGSHAMDFLRSLLFLKRARHADESSTGNDLPGRVGPVRVLGLYRIHLALRVLTPVVASIFIVRLISSVLATAIVWV